MEIDASFFGSIAAWGASYGKHYQRAIAGFYTQEFGNYTPPQRFAARCLGAMRRDAPQAYKFLTACSRFSMLSPEQHLHLMLHEEELYHRRFDQKLAHCTAVGLVSARSKAAFVGQNWDWSSSYYPWASFNRFSGRGHPRIVALSYPGMPICAGINSQGLALMWTGAGYYPPLSPKHGVPTYALLFELLLKSSVVEALDYLRDIKPAGAFIFLIADKLGELCVVEGLPGRVFVQKRSCITRANLFELPGAIKRAAQRAPGAGKCNSIRRNRILCQHRSKIHNSSSLLAVKQVLSLKGIRIDDCSSHATLFQLAADCGRTELHVRRWRNKKWERRVLTP